jgi:hypothetical protein
MLPMAVLVPLMVTSIVTFYVYFWPSFQALLWEPPSEKSLLIAHGRFVPKAGCRAGRGCIEPYRFESLDNRILLLNCEPYPPVNSCVPEDLIRGKDKNITIKYFITRTYEADYAIVMEIISGPDVVVSYNKRKKYVRSTYVAINKFKTTFRSSDFGLVEWCAASIFIAFSIVFIWAPVCLKLWSHLKEKT